MLKIAKFTDVCMTGGIMHTPSHTNVCKFRMPITRASRANHANRTLLLN